MRASKMLLQLLLPCSAVLALGATGCSHPTAMVYTAPGALAPGIPFFVKKGVCARESVWLEPQYTLTFSVFLSDQPPITNTITMNREGYLDEHTQEAIAELQSLPKTEVALGAANRSLCPSAVGSVWEMAEQEAKQHRPVPNLDLCGLTAKCGEAASNYFLVANTAVIKPEVDYTQVYYINSRSPWIGTGSIDAKLATDGTLTETNAQTDDETWSTIINGISTIASGYFTGAASASAAAAPATSAAAPGPMVAHGAAAPVSCLAASPRWPSPADNKVKYAWDLKTVIYKHDHTIEDPSVHDPSACTPLPEGVTGGSYTVRVVEPGSKPDPGAISVSGTVTLPKKDSEK